MYQARGAGFARRRYPAKQAFAVPAVTVIRRGVRRQLRPRISLYTLRKKQYVARTPGGNIVADNHYFDTERTVTAVTQNLASWTGTEYDPNTSAMLCLFAPVIGDDIFNRTGRKVFVKTIRINGQLSVGGETGGNSPELPCSVRILVYQDKQTNASQSQGEDVISSGAGSDALHMFSNAANFGRFRILKDKTFVLAKNPAIAGLTGAFIANGDDLHFKFDLNVKEWVNYNATNGGTVADVVDNSFHLIANCIAGSRAVSLTYKVRTVFEP